MAQEEKLGFVYPDLFSSNATTSHHHNPMQSYEPEIMHAAAGMEMLGFFPDKDVASARNPSSSAAATLWRDAGHVQAAPAGVSSTGHYYDYGPGAGVGFSHHHHQQDDDPSQLLSPPPQEIGWHPQGAAAAAVATAALYPGMESSSGDHYPGARTLSLSLCNSGTVGAPSPVGTSAQQQLQHLYHQQQQQSQPHPLLRGTKYLAAAQELLAEFCSLEGGADGWEKGKGGKKAGKQPEEGPSSSSSTPPTPSPSLLALDVVELQRRKARLLSMLEEVDRRYKRYCQQMQTVVASFEATTREGAATAYTAMASRAMSRHFRCLRDGVMGQIKAIRRVVEEKSCGQPTTPGTTKGETPRLKILDHYMRQQKAFQQGGGMMEHQPWRPQRGLPERSVSILRAWLFEHFLHPYPSDVDKHILARQTGLSRSQVSNWFINARVRLWKPMVEEMYLEETKEENDEQTSTNAMEDNTINSGNNNSFHMMDNLHNPKPESHSLSSIFRRDPAGDQAARALLGPADLDFFSYSSSNHYQQEQHHPQGQPFGPTGVSLTLGLVQQQQQQQYERGGVSLAFPPGGTCQPVETRVLSVMDGDVQGLPYRNLMGASQLLHDLAG